jgi:hypothetical protein
MEPDELDRRIEETLSAAPPTAPPHMAARIMERVDRVERARERLAESSRSRRAWIPAFAAFASEPAAAVALALVPVCLILWIAIPGTAAKLAAIVLESLAVWMAAFAGGFVAPQWLSGLGAGVFGGVAATALVAISFLALQWIAEPFRAFRPSTSRKTPPRR